MIVKSAAHMHAVIYSFVEMKVLRLRDGDKFKVDELLSPFFISVLLISCRNFAATSCQHAWRFSGQVP